MKIACARIVPKPLPGVQHLIQISLSQVLYGGPGDHKFLEVGNDCGNSGLLQHDLTDPCVIGLGVVSATANDVDAYHTMREDFSGSAEYLHGTTIYRPRALVINFKFG